MACNSKRPYVPGIFGQVPYFTGRCLGRAYNPAKPLSANCWVDCHHITVAFGKYGCDAGLMVKPEEA
jgi:hypothetical protein